MSSLRSPSAWISVILTFFMVLVLPLCISGALERARVLGQASPAGNAEEERDEHEEHEVSELDAAHRPPRPPTHCPVIVLVATLPALAERVIVSPSVALVTHPSLFSERRLI